MGKLKDGAHEVRLLSDDGREEQAKSKVKKDTKQSNTEGDQTKNACTWEQQRQSGKARQHRQHLNTLVNKTWVKSELQKQTGS